MCDWPEGKKMTLTRDTNKTSKPCSHCLISKSNLSKVNDQTRENVCFIKHKIFFFIFPPIQLIPINQKVAK